MRHSVLEMSLENRKEKLLLVEHPICIQQGRLRKLELKIVTAFLKLNKVYLLVVLPIQSDASQNHAVMKSWDCEFRGCSSVPQDGFAATKNK